MPTAIVYLLQGAALGITAAATPGPFQTYLINQTLTGGWRRSAPIAFVPLISDLPIIVLMLLLLDQLPTHFLYLISIAGGIFVLYMAGNFLRQWKSQSETLDEAQEYSQGVMRKGIVMNLLSPGPYTFWALVNGPILLTALRQSVVYGIAFLFGFYAILVGGFLTIALLFHQTRRLGPKVVRTLTLVSILILVIFGGVLIYEGIRGFGF